MKRRFSTWRNGTQQTDHDSQQQKTTQEQSKLAHRNLYSVMTEQRGRPMQVQSSTTGPAFAGSQAPGLEGIVGSALIRLQIQVRGKKADQMFFQQPSKRSFSWGNQPSSPLRKLRHHSQPFSGRRPSTCWPGSMSSSWAQ